MCFEYDKRFEWVKMAQLKQQNTKEMAHRKLCQYIANSIKSRNKKTNKEHLFFEKCNDLDVKHCFLSSQGELFVRFSCFLRGEVDNRILEK